MTFRMKKLSAAIVTCAALAGAGAVQAGPLQNFNLYDGAGNLLTPAVGGETTLEFNEAGSGVAKGQGPFGTPLVKDDVFEFLYQANVNSLTVNGAPAGLKTVSDGSAFGATVTAAKGFEYTVVARFSETVGAVGGIPGVTSSADFLVNAGVPRKVSIFYDDADGSTAAGGGAAANTALGTGFADGTEIARFTIDPFLSFSNFTANLLSGTGAGGTSLHASLSQADDFVNLNFLEGIIGLVFDIHYDGNQNYPPGTSSTTAFHDDGGLHPCTGDAVDCYPTYTVLSTDLLLKIDGSARTSLAIPEPGSLALLGVALAGLGSTVRRRSKQ